LTDLQTRSDPPIKRGKVKSIRESLEDMGKEVRVIFLGERQRSFWEKVNDWCEDQTRSVGEFFYNYTGLFVVALLVFWVLIVSVTLTWRLM